MASGFSPPVLYLTDDDDDNEPEPSMPYISSYASLANDNLPRKKRRLPNANVRVNPSVVNWSKRQRNDHYSPQHPQPIYSPIHHPPETIVFNSDAYEFSDRNSHSFRAFDWTSEPRTPSRTYANHLPTAPRMAIAPPPNVMNVVKHHLDHSDTIPMMPLPHTNDPYIQHSPRKSTNIHLPTNPPSPISLPLPTQTSSLVRPQAQRIHSGKNLHIPYPHSTPLPRAPLPPLSVPVQPHAIKPVFSLSSSSTSFRPPLQTSISSLAPSSEIRRQPLNGTGVLTAFYDSKCYRCNICKFITITSAKLLQHLFTHIFFCHQCSFYSYSQHSLFQHVFGKHHAIPHTDIIDPKGLELLYITRCVDGTFALCMDTSPLPAPPPPPSLPQPPLTTTSSKPVGKPINDAENSITVKLRKRKTRQKKIPGNGIAVLAVKHDPNPQPSPSSSSSSSSVIPKRPLVKEKQIYTYVLMKHRRCYSSRSSPCLHPLTLEYNICREHTIRHMCHTQAIPNRRKLKGTSTKHHFIDEVTLCLKTIVNHIVEFQEVRTSIDPVYQLPNTILDFIFPTAHLHTITNLLKLQNKYDKSIEQTEQNQLESSVRRSSQHVFILSSIGTTKNEQLLLSSIHTSITNADSMYIQTELSDLPISCDNTYRFLKGNTNAHSTSPNGATKPSTSNDVFPRAINPKDSESLTTSLPKPYVPRYKNMPPSSSLIDKSILSCTSSKARLSPTPSVIVID